MPLKQAVRRAKRTLKVHRAAKVVKRSSTGGGVKSAKRLKKALKVTTNAKNRKLKKSFAKGVKKIPLTVKRAGESSLAFAARRATNASRRRKLIDSKRKK
jgi:hypothetical protein